MYQTLDGYHFFHLVPVAQFESLSRSYRVPLVFSFPPFFHFSFFLHSLNSPYKSQLYTPALRCRYIHFPHLSSVGFSWITCHCYQARRENYSRWDGGSGDGGYGSAVYDEVRGGSRRPPVCHWVWPAVANGSARRLAGPHRWRLSIPDRCRRFSSRTADHRFHTKTYTHPLF